jgi:hypothetical protein
MAVTGLGGTTMSAPVVGVAGNFTKLLPFAVQSQFLVDGPAIAFTLGNRLPVNVRGGR